MDEKERSFINKIEELEKQNRSLQKEVNSLQGFLTKSVNENSNLQKQIDCLRSQISELETANYKVGLYKVLFLSLINGLEGKK